MSVQIILDSTTDLRPCLKPQVHTVPLTVCFGETEYIDGVTITHREFYEKLVETSVLPTTSQATPDAFLRTLEPLMDQGDTAVILTVASGLSGTWQSAKIAAQEYPGRVWVVDGTSVAIGTGILAELALQLRNQGLSAEEIAGQLEKAKSRVRVIALLDTLEYLKKGGRISAATALAGGLLGIKPVAEVRDGAIQVLGKARGSRQGNNLLVQQINAAGGVDFSLPVLLGYTGLSDALLEKYRADSAALWQHARESLDSVSIGSVVGTHAGPGAIAVAFFCREA